VPRSLCRLAIGSLALVAPASHARAPLHDRRDSAALHYCPALHDSITNRALRTLRLVAMVVSAVLVVDVAIRLRLRSLAPCPRGRRS